MVESSTPKPAKGRSPAYPGISLDAAVNRAQQLYSIERTNIVPIVTIMRHWGYKPTSGAGQVALAAVKRFGLLAEEGSGDQRRGRLTTLALGIIQDKRPDSQERREALQKAALLPTIHRELWNRYRIPGLPSDDALEFELLQRGFTESGARELIDEFRATLAFAKLLPGASISPGAGDNEEPGDEMDEGTGTELLERPKRRSPQSMQLPLAPNEYATIDAAWPITEAKWEQMLIVLKAMKPALVAQPEPLDLKPAEEESNGEGS